MCPRRIKRRPGSRIVGKALALLITIAAIVAAAYVVLHLYSRAENVQARLISEELSSLKDFSETAAAAEKGWSYPPVPPSRTVEQINKYINDSIDEQVKTLFPKKDITLAKTDIIRKYRPAREGERIEFQLNHSNDKIQGVFRGREGLSIKIDDRRIKIIDVLDEHRYLFDQPLAEKMARDKCGELDGEWQAKVDEFKDRTEKDLVEKVFPAEGYVKISQGLWRHQSDLVKEYVERRRKEFSAERLKAEDDIFARHKVFGLFGVSREKLGKGDGK